VKDRLDRALTTAGWCRRFPDVEVNVLVISTSDHKPLWVRSVPSARIHRENKSFKFEACWNTDVECASIINSAWGERVAEGDTTLFGAKQKLDNCRRALSDWSFQKYGSVKITLNTLTQGLNQFQRKEHLGNLECMKWPQKEIDHLLEMEDIRWQQGAKRNLFK
jgi:hypothetical protein